MSKNLHTNSSSGYSGADLRALCAEASINPLRAISDILNVDINNVRKIRFSDFQLALDQVFQTSNGFNNVSGKSYCFSRRSSTIHGLERKIWKLSFQRRRIRHLKNPKSSKKI